mgnify:CR=1 FL=1
MRQTERQAGSRRLTSSEAKTESSSTPRRPGSLFLSQFLLKMAVVHDMTKAEREEALAKQRAEFLKESKEELAGLSKKMKIPLYISDSADISQVRSIHRMVEDGEWFAMLKVPEWIQGHYLVRKCMMTVQISCTNGVKKFHRHWPGSHYLYPNSNEEGIPSLDGLKGFRRNDKMAWEFNEYLGCEYFTPQYTGEFVGEIPAFLVFGVVLPGGKKYVHEKAKFWTLK